MIAGLPRYLYWFTNLIFDFLFSSIFISIGCILVWYFDNNEFLSSNLLLLFILFCLTSIGCILLIYFFINLNLKRELINIIIKAYILFITSILSIYFNINIRNKLENKNELDLKDKLLNLQFMAKCLSPVLNLIDVLLNNFIFNYFSSKCSEFNRNSLLIKSKYYDLKFNILAYFIFYLICCLLIYLTNRFNIVISYLIEQFKYSKKSQEDNIKLQKLISIDHLNRIDDENVKKEEQLIEKLIELNKRNNNFIMIVRKLYKLFNQFVAVDQLSFTVKRGECFGLLGKFNFLINNGHFNRL